ncbi:MAG: RNA polymerase sporulation sigma factor SigK [Firmicutes bacterium]|nr:RNA polymerase sporulation sigma factor SigK [Bacillota bacterium]
MIFESFFVFISKVFFFVGYVNTKGSFPKPLTLADERMYIEKYMQGDQSAKNILIEHNLRLVAHVVRKYTYSGIEVEDLISIGTIGLIKAINSFKYDKATTLATYAARCIDNEILMSLRSNKKHKQTVSLFETICIDKDGNEVARMDILPDKKESITNEVEKKVLYEGVLMDMFKVLTEREKQIIIMRYGLTGDKPLTQIEIASKLDICRSYVSRIEKKSIKKLKDAGVYSW